MDIWDITIRTHCNGHMESIYDNDAKIYLGMGKYENPDYNIMPNFVYSILIIWLGAKLK